MAAVVVVGTVAVVAVSCSSSDYGGKNAMVS